MGRPATDPAPERPIRQTLSIYGHVAISSDYAVMILNVPAFAYELVPDIWKAIKSTLIVTLNTYTVHPWDDTEIPNHPVYVITLDETRTHKIRIYATGDMINNGEYPARVPDDFVTEVEYDLVLAFQGGWLSAVNMSLMHEEPSVPRIVRAFNAAHPMQRCGFVEIPSVSIRP